jgi:N-acetylglucosaminyldiphosphoundecaprenol N-acetyl-beta-D-mannosaminyltransferase
VSGAGLERAAPADPRPQLTIQGVAIDRLELTAVMQRIEAACEARRPLQIVTVNVNFLTIARRKPFFREVLNGAGLSVADGRILLWVSRLFGRPFPEQITGHDLMRECLALGRARGYRMFLLGGMPGVAEQLAARLEREHPGLRVEGTDGGRFSATGDTDQQAELGARIRAFAPHLLFVALGAPKQDAWIAKHLEEVGGAVAVGVGGVFDTLTGTLPRAPRWMQVCGLESLYQLLIDPRRYARRYLLDDPPTLLRIGGEVVRFWLSPRRRAEAGPR